MVATSDTKALKQERAIPTPPKQQRRPTTEDIISSESSNTIDYYEDNLPRVLYKDHYYIIQKRYPLISGAVSPKESSIDLLYYVKNDAYPSIVRKTYNNQDTVTIETKHLDLVSN